MTVELERLEAKFASAGEADANELDQYGTQMRLHLATATSGRSLLAPPLNLCVAGPAV
jgi:hypothetical protein